MEQRTRVRDISLPQTIAGVSILLAVAAVGNTGIFGNDWFYSEHLDVLRDRTGSPNFSGDPLMFPMLAGMVRAAVPAGLTGPILWLVPVLFGFVSGIYAWLILRRVCSNAVATAGAALVILYNSSASEPLWPEAYAGPLILAFGYYLLHGGRHRALAICLLLSAVTNPLIFLQLCMLSIFWWVVAELRGQLTGPDRTRLWPVAATLAVGGVTVYGFHLRVTRDMLPSYWSYTPDGTWPTGEAWRSQISRFFALTQVPGLGVVLACVCFSLLFVRGRRRFAVFLLGLLGITACLPLAAPYWPHYYGYYNLLWGMGWTVVTPLLITGSIGVVTEWIRSRTKPGSRPLADAIAVLLLVVWGFGYLRSFGQVFYHPYWW